MLHGDVLTTRPEVADRVFSFVTFPRPQPGLLLANMDGFFAADKARRASQIATAEAWGLA